MDFAVSHQQCAVHGQHLCSSCAGVFLLIIGRKIPVLLAPFKMTRKALHQPKAGCSFSSAEIQHFLGKTYYFLPKTTILTSGVSMNTYVDFSLLNYVYSAK